MKTKVTRPPKLAIRFFRWYCRSERQEELEGDLEEFFYQRLERGDQPWRAKLFFWWNTIRCCKSYAKSNSKTQYSMFPLFKSYFKLALRHSWKNKWSVLINVTGLGLALSMCVFVYTLYAYNIEFDSFFPDTEEVYRVHAFTFDNGQKRRNEISPFPLEDKLRNEISGVRQVSSYLDRRMTIKRGTDFFSEEIGVVDEGFLDMFEVPLWYGSTSDFGDKPTVLLTKRIATKYFGNEVALGKELTIYVSGDKKFDAVVGGVFEKVPLNVSFTFSILVSQNDYLTTMGLDPNSWSVHRYPSHYVKVSPQQLEEVTKGMNQYVVQQNEGDKDMKISEFELVPFISPIITDGTIYRSNINARLRSNIYIIFTTLISMVFLIACFNLANTSMALIAKRLKEIGIRKTLGSASRQILVQFLFEMSIVSALAFVIALSISNVTASAIMGLFGENSFLPDVDLTGIVLFIAGFLLFTTLVAGLLPALYAWKFQPVNIMRKSVKLKGVNWLNKSLTIAQYVFSIAVLSAGITFSRNSDFIAELDLGYQGEGVIDLNLGSSDHYTSMRQRVDQLPGVTTAGTRNHLANFGRYSQKVTLHIDTSAHDIRLYSTTAEYLDLMDVKLSGGRKLIDGSEADAGHSILVSQEFSRRYFDGNDPVNEVVEIDGQRKTIVGVVADIIDDVYEDMEMVPTVFSLDSKASLPHLIVKVNNRKVDEVQSELKVIWSELIDRPYNGRLQDDLALGSASRDTRNLQKIFIAMAILGAFLSIVGVFSLAKLNVARRLKEISIRKVLGATFRELLMTVNRSFVIVLSIAMLLGSVLGYFISDTVLAMIYKYYVEVSISTSLLSAAFIILVSILMIIGAVFAPANSNPVLGLREE